MTTAAKSAAEPTAPKRLILSVEQMIAAEDCEYAEVPAWKVKDPVTGELVQGYVRIGSLNAEDVIAWRETSDGPAKRTMGIRLFVNSLVDEKDNRIGDAKHYEAFKKKSNAVQERVLAEIVKMNGLTQRADNQTCPKCSHKFVTQTSGGDETKNG